MPKAPRPPIYLTETDAETLTALAVVPGAAFAADLLLEEIGRAHVVPDAALPTGVVQMHSTVEFVDEAHGAPRTVQLVFPAEADITAGKVSVLTPVGAGLIGLQAGQSIDWPTRDGQERRLRILRVA
jgi:regulator of nucleoside diphosphate kinase